MANISTITIKGSTYDLRDAESRNQITNINANIKNRLAYIGTVDEPSTNLPKYGVTIGDVWYVGKVGYFAKSIGTSSYKLIDITWQDAASNYMHEDQITNPSAIAVDDLKEATFDYNNPYTQIGHYYFDTSDGVDTTKEFYIVPVWTDGSHNNVVVCLVQPGLEYAYALSDDGTTDGVHQYWHGYLSTTQRETESGRPAAGYLIPVDHDEDADTYTMPEGAHVFSVGNEQNIDWEEFDNDYLTLDSSSKIDSAYLNYQMMDLSTYKSMSSYDSNVFYFITDVNEAAEGQA